MQANNNKDYSSSRDFALTTTSVVLYWHLSSFQSILLHSLEAGKKLVDLRAFF